ncbi:ABC transporter ATP-binding protein [Amnimonas aquatica]|uniref:High-affinity branched-chain amino acid transport ATP-binding protein n=1 Tax=Amnimonas aquatica TaxID=2094561 RepID=A0A2P6AV60_9GAMM|nr:ABC transporter ATP-binding protein [Amnimonas aquatica]PQA52007.1 ABC transporter ATP-binding protein [Amnimonas aquatica]
MNLLEVRDLEVRYGGIQAVRGISLSVGEGELVSLIGANGAGKTSTLGAIGGLLKPAAGSLRYAGEDLLRLPAHERVARGLALVPEGRGIFPRLTVLENLQMGAYSRRDRDGIRADLERMLALFPRLAERRLQLAGTLSGGEQQMLAIARALMSRPRLLLLDEPSMGLAPILVEQIFAIIRQIVFEGVALLLVEQNARQALEIASRAYVMESGGITLSGSAAELAADPRVRAAYLGD